MARGLIQCLRAERKACFSNLRRKPMTSPIVTAISDEHRTIARLLDLIEQQMVIFGQAGTPDLELLHLIMEYTRSYPDLYHHPKEDAIFKRLKERAPESAAAVDRVLDEHARLPAISREFSELVERIIEDATVSRDHFLKVAKDYVGFQRSHMMHETMEVLTAALACLTPQDWADIERSVEAREDPLVVDRQRYARLSDLILHAA
jgi:hemerythrin-like domain-containing protein